MYHFIFFLGKKIEKYIYIYILESSNRGKCDNPYKGNIKSEGKITMFTNRLVSRPYFNSIVNNSIKFQTLRLQSSAVPLAYDHISSSSKRNDKSPILIMHGLLGNKLNNRSLGRLLNDKLDRDIYLVDLRNHGSSPHARPHNYESMSEDIFCFIKDHELKQPILIGHSMGAKVGMTCVLRDKKSASMLICLDNAPICTVPNGKFSQYIQMLHKICYNKAIQTSDDADSQLATIEKSKFVRQFLLTVLKKVKREDTDTWKFEPRVPLDILNESIIKGNIAAWDFDSRQIRWVAPTLFLRGTESAYIADEYLPAIAMFFPNFEVKDLKAGHYLNVTHANDCATLIAEFIERHEST